MEDYKKYYPIEEGTYIDDKAKSHDYLVESSSRKMANLYEKLLEIPDMDMIFIKKPTNYLVYGSELLINEQAKYRKSFVSNPFSDFIKRPCGADYIFVFFSFGNISGFFEDRVFKTTESKLIEHFNISRDKKCFFIVFNNVVLYDLYRIHITKLQFIENSSEKAFSPYILFLYKNNSP